MRSFVDSNVFIQFFSNDDPLHRGQARKIFELAKAGELGLVTGPPVLFEVAWVLSYTYKFTNSDILNVIEAILSFSGLKVLDGDIVIDTIELARATSASFADAYIAVSAKRAKSDSIATFNKKHFLRLGINLLNVQPKAHENNSRERK